MGEPHAAAAPVVGARTVPLMGEADNEVGGALSVVAPGIVTVAVVIGSLRVAPGDILDNGGVGVGDAATLFTRVVWSALVDVVGPAQIE